MQADLEALPCAFTILTDDITTSTPRYDEEVTDQFCIALATAARSRFPPANLLMGEESVCCVPLFVNHRAALLSLAHFNLFITSCFFSALRSHVRHVGSRFVPLTLAVLFMCNVLKPSHTVACSWSLRLQPVGF